MSGRRAESTAPESVGCNDLIRSVASLKAKDVDRLVREAAGRARSTDARRLGRSLAGVIVGSLWRARFARIEDVAAGLELQRRRTGAAQAEAEIAAQGRDGELVDWRLRAARAIDAARVAGVFAGHSRPTVESRFDEDDDRHEAARSLLDLAGVACVAGGRLPRTAYEVLAGPWWRATARRTDPSWIAPWNLLSLGGFWLTSVAVIGTIAWGLWTGSQAFGPMANVELGAIATGVGMLVVGFLASSSAAQARLTPTPPRGPVHLGLARSLWRFPERAFAALIGRR